MRVRLILIAIAFLAASPVAAKPPLDYQDPPPDQLPGVAPFQNLPAIDESPPVVVATRKMPLWQAATYDPVLTNACRLGDFASVPLNPMVIRFEAPAGDANEGGSGALQWIPPDRRHLLVDRRHLAAPGEIYYFEDASYPSCRVWVENLVKPRHLVDGTSLPKVDPAALRKEKAMIKSWPQQ